MYHVILVCKYSLPLLHVHMYITITTLIYLFSINLCERHVNFFLDKVHIELFVGCSLTTSIDVHYYLNNNSVRFHWLMSDGVSLCTLHVHFPILIALVLNTYDCRCVLRISLKNSFSSLSIHLYFFFFFFSYF
jgi:hypothetical protein